MSAQTIGALADELYGLPLVDFTAARNDRAKQLRGEDRALAAAVKRLPKPSLAAWVVNVLVRHRAEEIEQVLALGDSLRDAQAAMAGAELRELTRQRRQLTAAVTTQARGVANDFGVRVSDAVADQVQDTLHAAMIDEGAAAAVRTGQLIDALAATGLGDLDVSTAVAVPESLGLRARPVTRERPRLSVVEDDPDTAAEAAAAAAARAADEVLAKATKKAEKAAKRLSKLEARALQLHAELEEVRRRGAELEHELEATDGDLEQAQAKRDTALERQETARVAAERARSALPGE